MDVFHQKKNKKDSTDAAISSMCSSNARFYDAQFEILLRLDPSDIFNCMLVSKEWLRMITDRFFHENYLKRLSNHSNPTFRIWGMLLIRANIVLPASHLWRNMNASCFGVLISVSPDNIWHLLGGVSPQSWYVYNRKNNVFRHLPPPPSDFKYCMANIVSDGDEVDFKVILAESKDVEDEKVSIQTFYSWTWKWEQFTLFCNVPLWLDARVKADSGVVDSGGFIYWKAESGRRGRLLASWKINRANRTIVLIDIPCEYTFSFSKREFQTAYGAPQGRLLSATCPYYLHPDYFEMYNISIRALDDGKVHWNELYRVSQNTIRSVNSKLLESLSLLRPKIGKEFVFVSFVPGRSDSIFLALGKHLFIYHFHTKQLQCLKYRPMTILDLRVWPSIPLSLRLPDST